MSVHYVNKDKGVDEGFTIQGDLAPEISLYLLRDAFLMYLQNEANDNKKRKYIYYKNMAKAMGSGTVNTE